MENSRESQLDLIKRYFERTLTKEDRGKIKELVAQDQTFRQEFEFQQDIQEALTYQHKQKLEKLAPILKEEKAILLKRLEEKQPTPVIPIAKPLSRKRRIWMPIAASVALLVLAGVYLFPQLNKPTVQDLYAAYPLKNTAVLGSDKGEDIIKEASTILLHEGKPQAAITKLEKIDSADPNYPTAQYLLGHAYFRTAQYEPSIESFSWVLNSGKYRGLHSKYRDPDEIRWYRLLAYVGNKDAKIQEEVAYFKEKYPDSDSFWGKKIKSLENVL